MSKAAESTDWESVKSKYEDITQKLRDSLPAENLPVKFPHAAVQITKNIVSSKLKAIRINFRRAVDSGHRSGHGRVVYLYFELCEAVWGGSPATCEIDMGLESGDIASVNNHTTSDASETLGENESNVHIHANGSGDEGGADGGRAVSTPLVVQQRRHLLNEKLATYKQEKLKRKISTDIQLLECAKEEIKIKRQLLDQMEKVDSDYKENITLLTKNVEKLTDSIAEGFSMFRNVLCGARSGMYMQPPQLSAYQQSIYSPHQTATYPMMASSMSQDNFD